MHSFEPWKEVEIKEFHCLSVQSTSLKIFFQFINSALESAANKLRSIICVVEQLKEAR